LIYGNVVEDGGGIGANNVGNIIANNMITNGAVGFVIAQGDNNIIFGNIITNNRGPGITKKEGLNNTFYGNYVANNSVGVLFGTRTLFLSGNNTLYRNNFINNVQQTQIVNLDHSDNWDNGKEGNHWSDYSGADLDGNGIGDTPYVMFGDSYHESYPYVTYGENYADRYPLMSAVNISEEAIKMPEWANVTLPSPLQIPSFPHAPNPSPLPSLSPSPTEASPDTEPKFNPVIPVAAAFVALVAVGLLMYFKKRKR
jgi:parallel beta-helix repeat protein